jgi:hypothetical protein
MVPPLGGLRDKGWDEMIRWWCKFAHGPKDLFFGGGKTYQCRRCSCLWPVPWAMPIPNPTREVRFQEAKAELIAQIEER